MTWRLIIVNANGGRRAKLLMTLIVPDSAAYRSMNGGEGLIHARSLFNGTLVDNLT